MFYGIKTLKNFIVPVGLMLQEFTPIVLVVQGPSSVGAASSSPPAGKFMGQRENGRSNDLPPIEGQQGMVLPVDFNVS